MAVFKRGKIWYTKFQVNGIKVYESTKCARRIDAEKVEKDLRRSLKLKKVDNGHTFDAACKRWIETEAPESMYSHIKQTLIYMENSTLTNAVKNAATMKQQLLQQGLNPQTVNRRLSVVRRVLNKAYNEYDMLDKPLGQRISHLMQSEAQYSREVFLSIEEATHILNQIPRQAIKNYIIGLCVTGLRQSELLNLQANQYINGSIRLTSKTKGKKPRVVPVAAWAQHCFKQLPMPVTYDQIRYAFEKARKDANMEHVRMHDLRHTFASWLASNPDIPFTVIRDLLGHASIKTTNRYTHLREDALKRATDQLPKIG